MNRGIESLAGIGSAENQQAKRRCPKRSTHRETERKRIGAVCPRGGKNVSQDSFRSGAVGIVVLSGCLVIEQTRATKLPESVPYGAEWPRPYFWPVPGRILAGPISSPAPGLEACLPSPVESSWFPLLSNDFHPYLFLLVATWRPVTGR